MKPATLDQPELLPASEPPTSLQRTEAPADGANLVLMFERLAKDPAVDVAKLEKLIDMQERILRHNAKAEFDAAFSQMQGEIPAITERGEIAVNGVVRSKYAKHEDILEVVKPILQKYGFAIRHRNTFTDGKIKIIGILSHRSGHSEEDEFEAKADDSGSKNAIQALGSTRSYGQRYTTISLLNIATKGADDDGHTSEKAKAPAEPAGYEEWIVKMSELANQGLGALQVEFQHSPREFRDYATRNDALTWAKVKTRASAVKVPK